MSCHTVSRSFARHPLSGPAGRPRRAWRACSRAAAVALVIACGAVRTHAADASPEAIDLVIDLLRDEDPGRRAIGVEAVRHGVRGAVATRRFAELLAQVDAGRQAALLAALSERGDVAAVPATTAIVVAATDPAVRGAAYRVLGTLGGAAEVPMLVGGLAVPGAEQAAALRALQMIRGPQAAAAIREAAASVSQPPATRAALLRILAERRDRAALPVFVTAAAAEDDGLRRAALESLARLGGAAEVAGVVQAVLAAAPGGDRDVAERALVAICTTNPGHPAAAEGFLTRFRDASDTEREALLPALARVGGPGTLAVVDALVADADSSRRRLGLKALSLWPDASVAGRLLDQLGRTDDAAERDVLVGGLIRIAPRPDNGLNDAGRLDLLRKTMDLCRRDEDRARVLERANAIRTIEALRFVAGYLDNPTLAQPACLSVVELAHHQKLREDHKPEFTTALDKVIATAKNAEHVERAQAYKAGKTWERKKG